MLQKIGNAEEITGEISEWILGGTSGEFPAKISREITEKIAGIISVQTYEVFT